MNSFIASVNLGGAFVASYVTFPTSQYVVGAGFIASGLSKLSPAPLMKLWPRLPKWFWFGSTLWEVSIAALLFLGKPRESILLANIFLGGVVSAVTVLHSPTNNLPILPVPIAFGLLVTSVGQALGVTFATENVYAIIGGFVYGVALDNLWRFGLGPSASRAGIKKVA